MAAEKAGLAMQDNAVLCSGSCNFDRCFNIGVAAGLVAEAAKAVGTFFPGCQDKDVVLFFLL